MIKTLRNFKYLKRHVVLMMDAVLSTFATLCSYFFVLSMAKWDNSFDLILATVGGSAVVSSVLFLISNLHRETIRHFAFVNILKIITVVFIKELLIYLIAVVTIGEMLRLPAYIAIVDLLLTVFFMVGMRSAMIAVYYYLIDRVRRGVKEAFIYSTRGYNPALVHQMNKDVNSKFRIRGFLTTNRDKVGIRISGEKVYAVNQGVDGLENLFKKLNIKTVIFSSNAAVKQERDNLVEFCIQHKIQMVIIGDIQQIDDFGNIPNKNIKPIQIEDLLERQEIDIDIEKVGRQIAGKVVMVTGAAGSIGSEIARQVASFGVKKLVLYDIAETPLHDLQMEFNRRFKGVDVDYVLADVRSTHRVSKIVGLYRPAIIFHAAAYKHVPMVEANPCEGVVDNVWGTLNMARIAMKFGVEKFVMISTDKAVNPTNVMGASKRIAEMCVQGMNRRGCTEFITTRFGNVLGSNGSVIPYFKSQIAAGGPVTVTHPDIIRYFMTIPEACRLVLQAAAMGHAGEVLVFDMGEQVRIVELARKMIRLSGFEPDVDIKIEYTGLRAGEKLYEELLSSEEGTEATQHEKIRVAQTSAVDIDSLEVSLDELISLAREVEIEGTVRLMKRIVPEFKSRNSRFEALDS